MTTKKIPSAIPYYAVCVVWLISAFLFPMYRWYHFAVIAVISIAVWGVMRKLFPGEEVTVEVPVSTGNEELDAVLQSGKDAIRRLDQLNAGIKNPQINSQVNEMKQISTSILAFLQKEPAKLTNIRTFMNYYLPTAIKLLETYQDLTLQGSSGENISGTIKKIEDVMENVVTAFRKELDDLFEGKAFDISAEIRALNTIMGNHGF